MLSIAPLRCGVFFCLTQDALRGISDFGIGGERKPPVVHPTKQKRWIHGSTTFPRSERGGFIDLPLFQGLDRRQGAGFMDLPLSDSGLGISGGSATIARWIVGDLCTRGVHRTLFMVNSESVIVPGPYGLQSEIRNPQSDTGRFMNRPLL